MQLIMLLLKSTDRALNVKPFVDYDVANITQYLIARGANVFTTIADIQERCY